MAKSVANPRRTGLTRWAGWLLAIAAGASGCSMSMTLLPSAPRTSRAPSSSASAARTNAAPSEKPEYLPDSLIDSSAPPKRSVVNVFGEFNHTRTKPAAAPLALALKQHTFAEAGYDADVSVDPTGQWLAFTGAREGERTQIYLQRVDSPTVTQLTNDAADDAQPCFSPDCKRIAFSSNRSGNWHLYLMNADGRSVTQITDGQSNDMHPSFSPSGTRLVYSSLAGNRGGAGEQWQLHAIDLVTRENKEIGAGLFPVWSPDKNRDVIAFQKTKARGSRWFSLWTCELKDGEAAQVTEIAVSANAALVSPSWSPDGKRLAFASIVEPGQTRNGKPQGQQDIWIIDADGSHRRRLTDGTATNLTPCWTVQNRVYFVSDRSGHECIWSLPIVTASSESRMAEKEMEPSSAAGDPSELKP
jgi:TolB protein